MKLIYLTLYLTYIDILKVILGARIYLKGLKIRILALIYKKYVYIKNDRVYIKK